MTATRQRTSSAIFSACILGVAITPLSYVAIGALRGFHLGRAVMLLLPSLVAVGLLLWRYLSRPKDGPRRRSLLDLMLELISWVAVLALDVYISDYNLLTANERFGATCTLSLVGAFAFLPVLLIRRTELRRRIAALPAPLVVAVSFCYIAVVGYFAVRSLVTPPEFI